MRLLIIVVICFLTGCQGVPLYSAQNAWSPHNNDHGSIRINIFGIPKSEPGVTLFYLAGALAGSDVNNRFSASIYDITDETQYLGTIDQFMYGWLEYNAPKGKRLLMLLSGGGALSTSVYSSSFLELEVLEGKSNYVAVSFKGFTRQPYLGEITIRQKDADFCESLIGKEKKLLKPLVYDYMKTNDIEQYAHDFSRYCFTLASPNWIYKPNEVSISNFNAVKSEIEQIKTRELEKWNNAKESYVYYGLMKTYPPKLKQDEW